MRTLGRVTMIRQIVTKTSANSISAINSDSNFSISINIGYDEKKSKPFSQRFVRKWVHFQNFSFIFIRIESYTLVCHKRDNLLLALERSALRRKSNLSLNRQCSRSKWVGDFDMSSLSNTLVLDA